MKCSPFIVFYATLLLLGQYVYSMDLTDEELPRVVSGVKMAEIGFSKADELSRWHLIVKVYTRCCYLSLYLCLCLSFANKIIYLKVNYLITIEREK